MRLFTAARDVALSCDAVLIDTRRRMRPIRLEALTPLDGAVDALLDRVALMARSPHAVRGHEFALFAGTRDRAFLVAVTEPFHDGLVAALRDALAAFGATTIGPDEPLAQAGLFPLLGFDRGTLAFFDSRETRPWRPLAARRALRIVAATTAHAPDPDVLVGGVPAPEFVR